MVAINLDVSWVVPHFGHWRVRLHMLAQGRAAMTTALHYDTAKSSPTD